jgi:formiminotetrahydrofolate cyclodeaminase
MIQQKLKATRDQFDPEYHPGVKKILINPDGPEAARYIQNMIEHMGHVVKIALEHVQDEETRTQIEAHAHAAIKGVQNENGAVFRSTRAALVRKIY